MQRNDEKYLADEGRLAVREVPAQDAVILSWPHAVAAPMARRFEEAYDKNKDDVSTFVIEFDSPGGTTAEGRRVVALMERIAGTHALVTRVGAGARFMFHEPASYDSFTGERSKEPGFERRFVADRFFDRYFENSPMDPAWRAQLERDWVGQDVWKSGEDLWHEQSGVLTGLAG